MSEVERIWKLRICRAIPNLTSALQKEERKDDSVDSEMRCPISSGNQKTNSNVQCNSRM